MSKNGNGSAETNVLANYIISAFLKETAADPTIQTTVEFDKELKKIIIPDGMTKKQAADDLMNQWNNEEQIQKFQLFLNDWDYKDGLRAFRNVIEDKFGWLQGGQKQSYFDADPTEMSIKTDYKNGQPVMESAFYGPVKFAAWENAKGKIGVTEDGKAYITLEAKKKFGAAINNFFKEVEVYLKNNSIYKGKAIIVTGGRYGLELEITEFKRNDKIILNRNERLVVDTFILGRLEMPGKRCYLFTGPYGNGKTETALNIACDAVKKGVSFFYLKNASYFGKTLSFATRYEPCIVFVEDIDEIASGEQRDADMNEILNTLDGVDTKGRDVTVLFTTNHQKRINPALRRPGRIDLIINFEEPDQDSIVRIFESFFNPLIGAEEVDYELVLAAMPKKVSAATVAELAKRSVELARQNGNVINTDRALACIESMKFQIEFMQDDVEPANEVQRAFETIREFNQYNKGF